MYLGLRRVQVERKGRQDSNVFTHRHKPVAELHFPLGSGIYVLDGLLVNGWHPNGLPQLNFRLSWHGQCFGRVFDARTA